jgi:hypothetical protein
MKQKRVFQYVQSLTNFTTNVLKINAVNIPTTMREHNIRITSYRQNGGWQTGVNNTVTFRAGQAFFSDSARNVDMGTSNSSNIIANTKFKINLEYSASLENTISVASAWYSDSVPIATDIFYITHEFEYEILD